MCVCVFVVHRVPTRIYHARAFNIQIERTFFYPSWLRHCLWANSCVHLYLLLSFCRHSTNTEWRECNVLCLNLYIFKMIFTYIHIMCCWVNIILVDKIICVSAGKAIFYVRQSRRRWQWWLSIACSIWGGIGDRHIYILRISRQCCRLASNDCEYLWESNMTGRRNLQLCSFRHIYHIGHR